MKTASLNNLLILRVAEGEEREESDINLINDMATLLPL